MSEVTPDIDLVQLSNRLAELEAKVYKSSKQRKKRFYCSAEVNEKTKLTIVEIAKAKGVTTTKLLAELIEEFIFNQPEFKSESSVVIKELDW